MTYLLIQYQQQGRATKSCYSINRYQYCHRRVFCPNQANVGVVKLNDNVGRD